VPKTPNSLMYLE